MRPFLSCAAVVALLLLVVAPLLQVVVRHEVLPLVFDALLLLAVALHLLFLSLVTSHLLLAANLRGHFDKASHHFLDNLIFPRGRQDVGKV